MNAEEYDCAVCGRVVHGGDAHVKVQAERVRIDDRNDRDEWVLHRLCAQAVTAGWRAPA